MTTKAMILASGRGERMMPLTRDVPKAMLKIGSVTLLAVSYTHLRAHET